MLAILEMEPTVPAHAGPWTERDYFALSELSRRAELIDGCLVLNPVGDSIHQAYAQRLCREFDARIPDLFTPLSAANVRLRTDRIVIPDLVVTTDLGDWLVVDASDVVLVGEVVSPSSRSMDRILKPALYAEAGIEWYLRVEQEPELRLVLQRRKDGAYVEHSQAGEGEILDLPEWGCSIDTTKLRRRG